MNSYKQDEEQSNRNYGAIQRGGDQQQSMHQRKHKQQQNLEKLNDIMNQQNDKWMKNMHTTKSKHIH